MDREWDIVGFGVAAVDDVFIARAFPMPGGKGFFQQYLRVGGGQTATAMVAASRLGCRCFYAGHLGENALSDRVRRVFAKEGIGFRETADHPDATPTHTLVIVDSATGERSNLANLDGVVPPIIGEWEEGLIARSACLLVDQSVPGTQLAAARIARANGIPVVGDLEDIPTGGELAGLIDHLIIPFAVAVRCLGATDPEEAVRLLMRTPGRLVGCVTDGERGAWYAASEDAGRVRHQPSFAVPRVVDTNGCGDIFHGAYAAALRDGRPLAERMRRAAAAAALKTAGRGGQTAAPRADELERFLREAVR